MKKFITSTFILLVAVQFLTSQDKNIQIPINKGDYITDLINLGKKGLVFKTGNDELLTKNLNWVVYYLTPDLEIKWKMEIEKEQISKGFLNPLVAAPNGKFIYQLEFMGYNLFFGHKRLMINQIDSNGILRRAEIKTEIIEGDIISTFCNDRYLYFLTQEIIRRDLKRIVLTRLVKFCHEEFKAETIEIGSQYFRNNKTNTNWNYLNHNNESIYLYRKVYDGEKQYTYVVAELNASGEKINEDIELSYHLDDKFIRPSKNERSNFGYSIAQDLYPDFSLDFSSDPSMLRSESRSNVRHKPRIGAYGGLSMDIDNKLFYVYGLYGNKKERRLLGNKYDGQFVIRFDENGDEDWRMLYPNTLELAEYNYYTIHGFPSNRMVGIQTYPLRKDIELHLWFFSVVYVVDISESGEVEESKLCDYPYPTSSADARACITSRESQGIVEYVSQFNERELRRAYRNHLVLTSGDLFIIAFRGQEHFDFLLFKE